jgi:hypothetical protein
MKNMRKNFSLTIHYEGHIGYLDIETSMVMFYGRMYDTINDAIKHKKFLDKIKERREKKD